VPVPKSAFLDPAVLHYLSAHTTAPDPLLRRLMAETEARTGERAVQQVPPEQGALLELLTHLTRARTAVELGTFTGYSSLCIARGLAPGGRLLTCDVDDGWTQVARRYWAEAGVADRIELHLLPAADFVATLSPDLVLDLVFVDADKERYLEHYEALLPRVRPGGLLLFDNVLWGSRVLHEDDPHPWTGPIRAFNDAVRDDPRVDVVLLPVADGLSLLRRRAEAG
jgi:caffeoyl-CoA O-methyltransferase